MKNFSGTVSDIQRVELKNFDNLYCKQQNYPSLRNYDLLNWTTNEELYGRSLGFSFRAAFGFGSDFVYVKHRWTIFVRFLNRTSCVIFTFNIKHHWITIKKKNNSVPCSHFWTIFLRLPLENRVFLNFLHELSKYVITSPGVINSWSVQTTHWGSKIDLK